MTPTQPAADERTYCCEALFGVPDGNESTCGRPGARMRVVGCIHEHLDEFPICDIHIERGIGCIVCHDLGHVCYLYDLEASRVRA